MKFSMGYQYPDEDSSERFPEILNDYVSSISELYFAPGNEPSGRSPAAASSYIPEEEAWKILLEDLYETSQMGVRLNLLFNANCLGKECISIALRERVLRICDRIRKAVPLHTVTTCSFFIAQILKKEFPDLEIRASVNMKLGTLEALEYAKEHFDSFCIQRDMNYRLSSLQKMAQWAKENNKTLSLLANSGCLRNCAAQTFHDNLVAHIGELEKDSCCMDMDPVFCRRFYADPTHREEYLMHSTLIRPEDVIHYEQIVPMMKLATRTHANPRLVLEAYSSGRFRGNLFDLTEPGHGIFYRGKVLDNSRIGKEYFMRKSSCTEDCATCQYCKEVTKQALTDCQELF